MIADFLRRFRRSLRAELILPALVAGALMALVAGFSLYALFKAHARDEMSRWAVSLADSVNYAAETSNNLSDLERFVTALGADPEIGTIVVAAGKPPQVLAATRLAWWRRPLAELPEASIRTHLSEPVDQGKQAHWGPDSQRLITSVPLHVHQPQMDAGRLAAGAVYVELDARPQLARRQFHALLAGGGLGVAILLMTALGLGLIRARVIAPVRAIQRAVEERESGDRQAYAHVTSHDEIGVLAAATNRLLDAQEEREALFRQMFSAHPAVQFLLDARDGTIVDINAATESFYGYSRDELIGQPISRINTLPGDRLQDLVDRVREEDGMREEFQHRLADGELRDVMVQAGVIDVGGHTYLHSIVHDITEANRYRQGLETYGYLFENLPVGVFRSTTGPEGRFLALNPAMAKLFRAEDPAELARHRVADLYQDPDDRWAILDELGQNGQVRRREVRMERLDGSPMWGNLTAYLYIDDNGTDFVDGILEDITERKAAEEALRQTERQLRTLLEHFPGGVLFEGPERRVVLVNHRFPELFRIPQTPDELVDADCRSAAQAVKALFIDPEGFANGIERLIAHQKPVHGQTLTMTDGRVLERDYIPIPGEAQLLGHLWLYRDVTERASLEAELQHQATHDRLTGVCNRLKAEEILEKEKERSDRYGTSFAAVMFDIDRFKAVNDTYGHDTGDAVLRELTRLVASCLRTPDTLARWGGEEFVVVLPETGPSGAERLAERLREAVAEHDIPGPGGVTISLGVAAYRPERPLNTLLKEADDALYRAKRQGRNRVEVAPD